MLGAGSGVGHVGKSADWFRLKYLNNGWIAVNFCLDSHGSQRIKTLVID